MNTVVDYSVIYIKGYSVYNPFRNALWPELACAKFLHQS